jgi:hypothetical protein
MELKEQKPDVVGKVVDAINKWWCDVNCNICQEGAAKEIQSIYEQAGYVQIQAGEDGLVESNEIVIRGVVCCNNCGSAVIQDIDIEATLNKQKALDDNKAKQEKRELADIIDNEYRRTENNTEWSESISRIMSALEGLK